MIFNMGDQIKGSDLESPLRSLRKRKSIESTSSVSNVHSETLTVKKPGRPQKVFIAPDVLTRKSNELVPEEEEATQRKKTFFPKTTKHCKRGPS